MYSKWLGAVVGLFVAGAVICAGALIVPIPAKAVTVTLTGNTVSSDANLGVTMPLDDHVTFTGTAIPTNQSINAQAVANNSTTTINYSASASQTILSHDFEHVRGSASEDYVNSSNGTFFTVSENTQYLLSGYYGINDYEDNFIQMQNRFLVELEDRTTGDTLFYNEQASRFTGDEHFILGGADGDSTSILIGSLAGELLSGHLYKWTSLAFIYAVPDTAGGAGAIGNSTLTIGVIPVPPALPLLASAFGLLGFLSWLRKRRGATRE